MQAAAAACRAPGCHVDVVGVVVSAAQVVGAHRLRAATVHTHPAAAIQTGSGHVNSKQPYQQPHRQQAAISTAT
jgi:hypothetical protein